MHFQASRAAMAVAFIAAGPAIAAETQLPPVVVTATRFAEADPRIPANISVIGSEEIAASPSLGLPDLLKSRAGIDVRPLYGAMGIDAAVDLRGFGDASGSNVLILLDGRRLNPIDSSGVSWSSIPLGNVERVEIIRGGGTVLYGDRATGGVINIITDKSSVPATSVSATAGSNGYAGIDANSGFSGGDAYLTISGHYAETDGWRRNSQAEQQSISGRGGMNFGDGRQGFVDYLVYKDSNGLPGYATVVNYARNPRLARTPKDNQQRDGYLVRPGLTWDISKTLKLEAELTTDHESYRADNVSFGSVYNRRRDTVSFTPRLRWDHGLGHLSSQTVVGLDYYAGDIDSNSTSFASQYAKQSSNALYAQNTTLFNEYWSVTAGARGQRMNQKARQEAYPPFFMPAFVGSSVRTRHAFDLGLAYTEGNWRAYGKTGTTFRFANTDELFGYDPFTGNPVFAGDLKPQHGTVREIGGTYCGDRLIARAALYRMELRDEIGFDNVTFANTNFAPTRRNGLESEFEWQLDRAFKLTAAYAYTEAKFSDGANAGKTLPLVPRENASLQLSWDSGNIGRYAAAAHYIGDRYYSGDFANVRGHLAGYTTMDLRADWNLKPWLITARVLNAFDQRYAPFAGYSVFLPGYYYYPADGRSLFLSARYDFK